MNLGHRTACKASQEALQRCKVKKVQPPPFSCLLWCLVGSEDPAEFIILSLGPAPGFPRPFGILQVCSKNQKCLSVLARPECVFGSERKSKSQVGSTRTKILPPPQLIPAPHHLRTHTHSHTHTFTLTHTTPSTVSPHPLPLLDTPAPPSSWPPLLCLLSQVLCQPHSDLS